MVKGLWSSGVQGGRAFTGISFYIIYSGLRVRAGYGFKRFQDCRLTALYRLRRLLDYRGLRRITGISVFEYLEFYYIFRVTGCSGSNVVWADSAFGWVRGCKPFEWLHDFKFMLWVRQIPNCRRLSGYIALGGSMWRLFVLRWCGVGGLAQFGGFSTLCELGACLGLF
jgi:hypothetical protein